MWVVRPVSDDDILIENLTSSNGKPAALGCSINASACPVGGGDLCGWGDWAVWGGFTVPINDKLQANAQVAYTDSKILEVTGNLRWNPVKSLLVQPEVTYTNFDSVNQDQWAGILRFQRSF